MSDLERDKDLVEPPLSLINIYSRALLLLVFTAQIQRSSRKRRRIKLRKGKFESAMKVFLSGIIIALYRTSSRVEH